MKWLFDEVERVFEALKRGSTWLVIGIITLFGVITFTVAQFAFRTDNVLRFLRISVGRCQEMSNAAIIFLFCGLIFFALAVVTTFGEIQRYYALRDRNSHFEARQAATYGMVWGGVAVSISIAALLFFHSHCS